MSRPGIDEVLAPKYSQASIDARFPNGPGRSQYRLTSVGRIVIDGMEIMGPQLGGTVASQTVYLSAAGAAQFGARLEVAP